MIEYDDDRIDHENGHRDIKHHADVIGSGNRAPNQWTNQIAKKE